MSRTAVMCWSGGKDSALALHRLQQRGDYEIVALLVTITRDFDRVSMHGVRRELIEQQARSLGLPLAEVSISQGADNREYESAMARMLSSFRDRGVSTVAYGDIFLEDLRQYRIDCLQPLGMQATFPLWRQDTTSLYHEFLDRGFQAITVCVNPQMLPRSFVGRPLDERLLIELPPGADPCGEHGEFHSFVYDGPNFAHPISWSAGRIVERNGFVFQDLLPAMADPPASGDSLPDNGWRALHNDFQTTGRTLT